MNKEKVKEFGKKILQKAKRLFREEKTPHTRVTACRTALAVTAVVFLFCVLFFDFYFDLNDDVLMKDILSGAYTGVPEARNIQMLFPISLLLSLLYRLPGNIDWYGIFLLCCQFGCFTLLLYRTLRMAKTKRAQTLSVMLFVLLLPGVLLSHLVYVQYTVTAGLMVSTAAFLLMTAPLLPKEGRWGIARRFGIPVALILLAYLLRSEMTLLMLPFALAAVCIRILMTDRDRSVREILLTGRKTLLPVVGVVLAGLFVFSALDYASTMSADWHSFRSFFNARTELYDFYFYDMPTYEKDRAFFEELGLTKESAALLDNYNFSLDEEIDEEVLWQVVEKAREHHDAGRGAFTRLKDTCVTYLYRVRHLLDRPYSLLIAAGYILVILYLILMKDDKRRIRGLLGLLLLFVIRTGLWMFLLYRERAPERITHSLLLAEILLLAGGAVLLLKEEENNKKIFALLPWLLIGLFVLPGGIRQTVVEKQRRERVNAAQEMYLTYVQEHPDNVYFTDVYSTVKYSEKMFDRFGRNKAKKNADLMGGWAAKSPLYQKRMQSFGLTDMQSAIAEEENVFVISSVEREIDWLQSYYISKGIDGMFAEEDRIGDDFIVYRFEAKQ